MDQSYKNIEGVWPIFWVNTLNTFQRLIIIKILRPDEIYIGIQYCIMEFMGQFYIEFPPIEFLEVMEEATITKPVIFILSSGSDPLADVE